MFRYLAFIWHANDRSQLEAAKALRHLANSKLHDFECVLSLSGLYVTFADPLPNTYDAVVLPGEAGVVLGFLYQRNASLEDDSPARTANLGWEQSYAILRS